MIVDLPNTTTAKIAKEIQSMRDQGGVVTLGRVLTLVVTTRFGEEDEAIDAANLASREHPCRILVLAEGSNSQETRLDAQIRVGGDAGASEVIVLHASGELSDQSASLVSALLLPDAPIVAWWPAEMPEDVADSAIGKIAHRRITDSANQENPIAALRQLGRTYEAGNTDLAWTRLTNWRIQLAAALDQLDDSPITSVRVQGASDSPSTLLLGSWLGGCLNVPTEVIEEGTGSGIHSVVLIRESGNVTLERPGSNEATLTQPGQPVQHVALARRSLQDCLAEELRRLDPDDVYGEVITDGLTAVLETASERG